MKGFNPPVTPEKIVKEGWRFSIPIYQRLFVWESEQIDRLLEDLWKASKSRPSYYIGVITTVEQDDGKNGRVFSVVDGQQRLTFLLLFFCECSARIVEDEVARKFVLVEALNTSVESLRIRFIGRNDDEFDIQRYLDKDRAEVRNWDEVKNWNFRQFHERMELFIKKHDDWETRKDDFINYVYENTAFLANELVGYSNADLNLYFEKMNSTGRQLSPLDQLKGILTSCANDKAYASEWNDCFNFEKTRKESEVERGKDISDTTQQKDPNAQKIDIGVIVEWMGKVSEEPPQHQEAGTFARLPMRPEILALHALQLTLADNPRWKTMAEKAVKNGTIVYSSRHLLETFKTALGFDSNIATKFMDNLKNYRDWIDGNIIYLRGEEESDGDDGSNSSGLKYAFRRSGNGGSACFHDKMLQLQSMLYVSSGERQEWILEAYNDKERREEFDSLFNVLRELALSEVEDLKPDALSYSSGMDRRAFWTLDYLLWEKVYDAPKGALCISFCDELEQEFTQEQIGAIKRYRFTQNRSVEHLHPQNPQNESETDEWKSDRKKNQDAVRNSFGNLCMISQSTNSSFGNEQVNVKFEKLRNTLRQQSLQSIKLMLMFAACGGDHFKWTPKQAITHGTQMLKILGVENGAINNWKEKLDSNNVRVDE